MDTPFISGNYCSVLSSEAEEPLIGTAAHTETFLLLENNDSWGKNVLEDSLLETEVKDFLQEQLQSLPLARLLFLRGQNQPYGIGPRFFVVRASDPDPAIFSFQLNSPLDLLNLDVQALTSPSTNISQHRMLEPLYLVCTHGRRDVCCAKFGLPVYRELFELEGNRVWQSSHLGGHRFAPNLLVLPHGLLYGRLGTQSSRDVVEAYSNGKQRLERLRGRMTYPPPAQAADYFLRTKTGRLDLSAFRLVSVEQEASGVWNVSFKQDESGQNYSVIVSLKKEGQKVFESCQSGVQTEIKQFELVNW